MLIIGCCSKKKSGGVRRTHGLFDDYLLGRYRDALMLSLSTNAGMWTYQQRRAQRAPEKNLAIGRRNNAEVMPAIKRYDGIFYQRLDALNGGLRTWLAGNNGGLPDVYIISALYGVIESSDEIADYDLMMTDTCRDPACLQVFGFTRNAVSVRLLWRQAFTRVYGNNPLAGPVPYSLGFLSDDYCPASGPWRHHVSARRECVKVANGNTRHTLIRWADVFNAGVGGGCVTAANWHNLVGQPPWHGISLQGC
ncbi:MAG: peroxide stress protein YaaA [Gammaproteobacteria bacterium]|jgi:hypothetical protein|nr:peroxide stress protein YaaA [Gammaproteobacteria bacterium]|tara:strand:- start:65 stop:817 length:753 start_codon:yes stop_codon:yes gene_type:complete